MKLTYADVKDKLEQMHKILFQILCAVDDFCRENNLTYYLCAGTCLGAARHQGFIPWDADADIMLPRKDYEKLIRQFGKAYPGKYAIGALGEREGWYRPFAKIWDLETKVHYSNKQPSLGVYVDVFPIDGFPDSKSRQKIHFRWNKFWYRVIAVLLRDQVSPDEKYKLLKKMMIPVRNIFSHDPLKTAAGIGQKIERKAKKYDFESSNYVGLSVDAHYLERDVQRREDEQYPVYLDFEGRKMPVINGYKNYLRSLYGSDYMEIPSDDYIQSTWDWHLLETAKIELPGTQH